MLVGCLLDKCSQRVVRVIEKAHTIDKESMVAFEDALTLLAGKVADQ